ncbi:MAG: SAM-dependent methyltransferase [Kiritimatiellae bacterium]|nr:SAM-dependent methyltransferase [Kiritimatiellia bacterium]
MEKYELDSSLAEEIRSRVFGEGFIKIVQSVKRGGEKFTISLRPVSIGGEKRFQAEMREGRSVQVKNFDMPGAAEGLDEIIAQKGARELHLITASGDLHVRTTKKGRSLVSRSKPMERDAAVRPHDKIKNLPLTSFDSAALLEAVGIAVANGAIRASMRPKYDQVNDFLRELPQAEDLKARKTETFTVVDCGCGKAYLKFAMYFHLTRNCGLGNVKVIGVDRRSDVIDAARKTAKDLGLEDKVVFEECDLAAFDVEKADMVTSLHACDTATDEALAKGAEWKARWILSAPCCQHELQKNLGSAAKRPIGSGGEFAGLLRQSILRERLCDILTDAYRALIMRIIGYRTQTIEFVSREATAKNIMLKCEYGLKPGLGESVGEYLSLRDYWQVKPFLEERLGPMLSRHLEKYS